MAAPALIYSVINWGDPVAMKGWAIPSATEIAFALGVLSRLGDRVPQSVKLFLLTLAIVDDLGAIVVVAVFYTADISPSSLGVAAVAVAVLFGLNRKRVLTITPYIAVGVVLWVAVLKSGVHATLAAVVLALFLPLRTGEPRGDSPVERLLRDLHPHGGLWDPAGVRLRQHRDLPGRPIPELVDPAGAGRDRRRALAWQADRRAGPLLGRSAPRDRASPRPG
jgi:NhaA family Na+:H+ antiporter